MSIPANKMNYSQKTQLLFKCCGYIGIGAVMVVTIANIIGMLLVENHDPIADTISALAIGKLAWIQDIGLDSLAVGVAACALALLTDILRTDKQNIRLIVACVLLFIVGIDIVVIAEHNQYAGRPGRGASIHIYCVIILGILLATIFHLLQPYFEQRSARLARINRIFFWAWLIFAPVFFMMPDSFDGLYERVLALIPLSWIVLVSIFFIRRAEGKNDFQS